MTTTVLAPEADATIDGDVRAIASARIFFGHQSVGMNLLDGMARALAGAGARTPRIVETAEPLVPGTIGHAFVDRNGSPELKIASFDRALASGVGDSVDFALMKLCWADFTPNTDARALFARYRGAINALRRRYPRAVFAHVTAPLTTVRVTGGAKGAMRSFLHRVPRAVIENARREEFNELMRRTYDDAGLVFDLARLESTALDGSRELHRGEDGLVAALSTSYTDDGGHLNDDAATRFGRELLAFFARLVRLA